ncbi:hypothetical protein AGLY_007378 [Aphis glycines]|uniref:Reverse transcriptase domain-containing protein n=1 Tax=Aphis glycines TaxID=307491 RepID=A0A6G0TPQ1_APHGL|nr:hypothetical protein AGLY_007378 [Aphis glycines]
MGVTFLAFADDIALVATAKDNMALEQMLTTSAQKVHKWLNKTGLELALHKCEAMIITKTRTNNDMNISINGHKVESKNHMKYLGVHLDSKWSFSSHAKEASAKASKVAQILIAKHHSCQTSVRRSGERGRCKVTTSSAYCTVSGDAIAVITGVAHLDITAKDRSDQYNNHRNPENIRVREHPMTIRQRRWDESTKCRWTHKLITDIKTWAQRKHGEINFHLTQVLSGHGCFSKYLKKYAKLERPTKNKTETNKRKRQKPPPPDAIAVRPTEGETAVEILKAIKHDVEIDKIGALVSTITESRSGEIIIRLNAKDAKRTVLEDKLRNKLGTRAGVRGLTKLEDVEIQDLESVTTATEVKTCIRHALGAHADDQTTQVRSLRQSQRATVRMKCTDAHKLEKAGKVKIGWVYARARIKIRAIKFYRCLGYGHRKQHCTGVDRTEACCLCTSKGHMATTCKSLPKCAA